MGWMRIRNEQKGLEAQDRAFAAERAAFIKANPATSTAAEQQEAAFKEGNDAQVEQLKQILSALMQGTAYQEMMAKALSTPPPVVTAGGRTH